MKFRIPFFAFNKRRKHPSYVFKEKDGKYHNLLITHSKEDKKRRNIPLYRNPNPDDNSKAYIHNKVYVDPKNSFDRVFSYWKFHSFDKRKIKRIKKNKKKR